MEKVTDRKDPGQNIWLEDARMESSSSRGLLAPITVM